MIRPDARIGMPDVQALSVRGRCEECPRGVKLRTQGRAGLDGGREACAIETCGSTTPDWLMIPLEALLRSGAIQE